MSIRINRPGVFALALVASLASSISTAGDRLVIVSEGAIAKDWQPAPDQTPATPAYPSVVADKTDQVCLSVGYRLNPDGTTSDPALLKTFSARHPGDDHADYIQPFARNAIAAVQQWRFVPVKPDKRRTLYTSATFTFGGDPASLRERCAIGNLPAFIAKAQAEALKRGNLSKGDEERFRQRTETLQQGRY